MAKTLCIDPVTRIEGHLAIETHIDQGAVTDARISGRMFRGFEQLLLGRHPVDAARITQRVCGICHEVHGIAASIALEDLYRLTPSDNGRVLRELILGLHLVTDHIFHFYLLSLPDYIDFGRLRHYQGQDTRVTSLRRMFENSSGTFGGSVASDALEDDTLTLELALGYTEAIRVRKQAGSGLASLGGKVPFCHAILPGGLTTDVTTGRLMNFANALEATTDFVKRTYLPQARALAEHFRNYFAIGRAHGNFYANQGFTLLDEPLFSGGVSWADGRSEPVRFDRISEDVDSSYLDRDGHITIDKPGAYSWVRAELYAGQPMEVGPLARMAVNRPERFISLLKHYGQTTVTSSVMARLLARACEAELICDYLQKLLPTYQQGQPTIAPPDMLAKPTGSGHGMSIAARGALNHVITTEDGKVTRYRLQVPSAWNFGPAAGGAKGTVEQALLGTRVHATKNDKSPATKDAVEIARIVRSFDPCLACAIH